jgi:hypothetical protein
MRAGPWHWRSRFPRSGGLAGRLALGGPQDGVDAMVREYQQRRDLLVTGLNHLPGVSCPLPQEALRFPQHSSHRAEFRRPGRQKAGWRRRAPAGLWLRTSRGRVLAHRLCQLAGEYPAGARTDAACPAEIGGVSKARGAALRTSPGKQCPQEAWGQVFFPRPKRAKAIRLAKTGGLDPDVNFPGVPNNA